MNTNDPFIIMPREAARTPMYLRLHPDTIKRLKVLENNTGINKAEIVQQALDFALERLSL